MVSQSFLGSSFDMLPESCTHIYELGVAYGCYPVLHRWHPFCFCRNFFLIVVNTNVISIKRRNIYFGSNSDSFGFCYMVFWQLFASYQTQNNYDDRSFDMVADRSMLCVKYLVTRSTDLYSILYAFGDKDNIIGYPGKNGSKHFLYDSGTLFVRKNVAEDKRKIILEFFEYLLSYEEQKRYLFSGLSDGFSARDDVLSEQIDAIKDIEGERAGLGNVMFTFKDIDTKAARNKIDEIMNRSVSYRDFSDSFYFIIEEEIGNYFAGSMALDKLEDNLNKRIGIYIKERE